MKSVSSELDLYEPVMSHFAHYTVFCDEVPLGRRRIDLVFLSRNGLITAVELKVDKWRDALSQALINQLISDYSYVALPISKCRLVEKEIFEENGVGLLAVADSVKCKIPSRRLSHKDPELARSVRRYVLEATR